MDFPLKLMYSISDILAQRNKHQEMHDPEIF